MFNELLHANTADIRKLRCQPMVQTLAGGLGGDQQAFDFCGFTHSREIVNGDEM